MMFFPLRLLLLWPSLYSIDYIENSTVKIQSLKSTQCHLANFGTEENFLSIKIEYIKYPITVANTYL